MRNRGAWGASDGAAAVELALLLPLLVLVVGGIVDFGFAFNAQIGLTHAAREGARVEAIGSGDGAATALNAYVPVAVRDIAATVDRACPHDDGALVTIGATYDFFLLPFGDVELTSGSVMRCNG